MALQHLRSSTANKRPTPGGMSDGQLALNTNVASPGIFFKDSTGALVKAGPVHVGSTAPNASPAVGGQSGNSIGELWLDTSVSPNQLKTWNGSAWVSDFPDEIPVAKLADGAARQLLQTDAAGTGVEWTSNVDVPGTLDVTSTATFDSIASHPLGSAGAPTITFTGDTNTGIYSPGADQLAISTNGTGRLFVDASGNVGAGVSSPSVNLDVQGSNGVGLDVRGRSSDGATAFRLRNNASTISNAYISASDAAAEIGSYSYLAFATGTSGLERARITSDGKLGLGNTVPINSVKFGLTDSTNNARIGIQDSTANTWYGIANNNDKLQFERWTGSAWSSSVTIDNAGRVGVGTTSPGARLEVAGSIRAKEGSGHLNIAHDGTNGSISNTAGQLLLYADGSNNIIAHTNSVERCRLDASGRLLLGTSSYSDGATLVLQGNSTNSNWEGILRILRNISNPAADNDLGTIIYGVGSAQGAQIKAVSDAQWGTNDYPTRLVFSTTADGASSPTERMRIRSDGGLVYGTGATPGSDISSGTGFWFSTSTGLFYIRSVSSPVATFNRGTDDGTLVEFKQDQTTEGTISVSGTTVSYNGAHLSRWSQLPGGVERTEILRGTVLSNIDEMCEWVNEENEQLNRMKVSDVEGDKNVSGVFQAWDDDDDTYTNDFYCAMTGDFIIRIGAGVTVERGDLLMSAGDGTAKPQDDDIIRSKTIAKVTSTNVSCTYDDGSYCVPCVLTAC